MHARRVLLVIPTLHLGGAQRVITTLLRYFDRSRICASLAVVDLRNAVYRQRVPADTELIDLDCRRVRYALPRIVSLVRRHRPDVVFSTLGHLNLALAMARPFMPSGTRFVAREATIPSEHLPAEYRGKAWLWSAMYRVAYSRFDAIICQSRGMQRDLMDHFGVPQRKTSVVYNPVDLDELRAADPQASSPPPASQSPERVRLVVAGRLERVKGYDLLLQALALTGDPRLHLDILGTGTEEGLLREMVERLNLSRQVRFLGFQQNPWRIVGAADWFVLSSRYEGLPNTAIEALACGTPVISTPAPGGVREILEPIPQCVIADSVTPEGLSRAIVEAAARRPAQRVPPAAVQRFSPSAIARQYEDLLLAL